MYIYIKFLNKSEHCAELIHVARVKRHPHSLQHILIKYKHVEANVICLAKSDSKYILFLSVLLLYVLSITIHNRYLTANEA